jgi:uncharacterized membrane protein YidH (DUF202 family)
VRNVRRQERHTLKNLAFVFALLILIAGVGGILEPAGLVWIAQHTVTSGAYWVVALVRVAFGIVLISAASASRAPRAIRVLGIVVVIVGITTAVTAMVGMVRAREIIEWWLQQGPVIVRLSAVPVLLLGGFVAYACAPVRSPPPNYRMERAREP